MNGATMVADVNAWAYGGLIGGIIENGVSSTGMCIRILIAGTHGSKQLEELFVSIIIICTMSNFFQAHCFKDKGVLLVQKPAQFLLT